LDRNVRFAENSNLLMILGGIITAKEEGYVEFVNARHNVFTKATSEASVETVTNSFGTTNSMTTVDVKGVTSTT
tara:strand:- start:169 stop:390 length:222 start_codon:yes stop_codon:yes gene_type:complete